MFAHTPIKTLLGIYTGTLFSCGWYVFYVARNVVLIQHDVDKDMIVIRLINYFLLKLIWTFEHNMYLIAEEDKPDEKEHTRMIIGSVCSVGGISLLIVFVLIMCRSKSRSG